MDGAWGLWWKNRMKRIMATKDIGTAQGFYSHGYWTTRIGLSQNMLSIDGTSVFFFFFFFGAGDWTQGLGLARQHSTTTSVFLKFIYLFLTLHPNIGAPSSVYANTHCWGNSKKRKSYTFPTYVLGAQVQSKFTLWLVVQYLANPKRPCYLTLLVFLWSPSYHLGLNSSPVCLFF